MMDPQAKAVLDELKAAAGPMPADEREWLAGYRAQLEAVVAMQGKPPAIAVVDRQVGSERVPLRLYRPDAGTDGRWPALLFIHGGGFVAGAIAGYDVALRWLALRSGWQVAAVGYRLAPEHPYPAAVEDCDAALDALLTEANLGADSTRVAVGGDSAGGLLAAVLARRARDRGDRLALQVLLYPNTDLREGEVHASRREYDGTVIQVAELYRSLALYLGPADRSAPDASPLLAPDLEGLCPALLVTNENDPLRDEGEAYGQRLRDAGVAVTAERLPGMIHTAFQRGARIQAGDALISRVAAALRAAGQPPNAA